MSFFDYDFLFKIIIIGDTSVGKSSIMQQYVNNFFIGEYISTIGVDFLIKNLIIDNKKIKLQIWDTAGQEKFRSITKTYYRNVDAVILMYDITNLESFNHISNWINEINKFIDKYIPIIIIGNKNDLEKKRMISFNEGLILAKKYNALFDETSAKDYNSIDNAIIKIIKSIKNNNIKNINLNNQINLNNNIKKKCKIC